MKNWFYFRQLLYSCLVRIGLGPQLAWFPRPTDCNWKASGTRLVLRYPFICRKRRQDVRDRLIAFVTAKTISVEQQKTFFIPLPASMMKTHAYEWLFFQWEIKHFAINHLQLAIHLRNSPLYCEKINTASLPAFFPTLRIYHPCILRHRYVSKSCHGK